MDEGTDDGQSCSHTNTGESEERGFTTEIFKIEIGNLPKCYSICVSTVFILKNKEN